MIKCVIIRCLYNIDFKCSQKLNNITPNCDNCDKFNNGGKRNGKSKSQVS